MDAELSISRDAIVALADDIAETAAYLDAATHRLLSLIRQFDRARGWNAQGALSCAHWLSWRIGMDLGTAREKVRVAHRLAELPLIDEALRRGELSFSKVRAMTRVATPDNEAVLLDQARCTTAGQLERICRFYRQVRSQVGADPRVEDDRRWVVSRQTDDGMVSIQIRLLPDEAARVMRAIEGAADGGSLADGAVVLAENALSGEVRSGSKCREGVFRGPAEGVRGPVEGVRARVVLRPRRVVLRPRRVVPAEGAGRAPVGGAGRAPAGGVVRAPIEVVVHVDAATLTGQTEAGDGLSAETCRRLLCDAGVVPILEDSSGRAIDVGRKSRTVSAALRRALDSRDRGCRFPGCSYRRCDAHHVVHWLDGGETSLANCLKVCRRHHRFVHEYGFSVVARDDDFVFYDADGRKISAVGARPRLIDGSFDWLRSVVGRNGVAVSAETNVPGWDGQVVDYNSCVWALMR